MVKIVYSPYEEIVIHEIAKFTREGLIELIAGNLSPGQAGTLYWANKILFSHSAMPKTAEVVAEQLENRLHLLAVTFALCEDYEPTLRSKNNFPINIFNVSNNKILDKVTRWLYKQATSTNPPF